MKNIFIAALLALAAGMSARAQVPSYIEVSPDLGPQIQIALPGAGDFGLYESGVGMELQFRDWVNQPWGYLLAIGYAEWQADSGATKPGANFYDYDGDLEIIPFGASAIYQVFSDDDLSVTLEAGFRYLIMDSKIDARNSDQSPTERYDLDIGDSIVARFAGDVEYVLSKDFIGAVGLAYQLDTKRGDIDTDLGPARDNIMESFILELSLRMPL